MAFEDIKNFIAGNNGSSLLEVPTVVYPCEVFCDKTNTRVILHGRGTLNSLLSQSRNDPKYAIDAVMPCWLNGETLTPSQASMVYLNSPSRFRSYVYDLTKMTYFLGIESCEIEITAIDLGTHNCRCKLNGKELVQNLPLAFLEPNFQNNDWADMLWDKVGMSKVFWPDASCPICPECKGNKKVTLFQFHYNCSTCGDGKRV